MTLSNRIISSKIIFYQQEHLLTTYCILYSTLKNKFTRAHGIFIHHIAYITGALVGPWQLLAFGVRTASLWVNCTFLDVLIAILLLPSILTNTGTVYFGTAFSVFFLTGARASTVLAVFIMGTL